MKLRKEKIKKDQSIEKKCSGDRSERIRTYNFPQGRVTDHRINLTLHKLDEFLSGEIHEEMNQELRLKEQNLKLENLNMKASEAIKLGSNILKECKIPSFILDSEILLSKTLNKSREEILTNLNQKIEHHDILVFKDYIVRRSKNEPVAYILKEKEFWSKKFYVTKDTLIPRPETELLVDKILHEYKKKRISILDIGTGSGCILLSLLSNMKHSIGIGIDISKEAIKIARKNALKHNLLNQVKFYNKSLEIIYDKKFDVIVSNPPYIVNYELKNLSNDIKRYEPRMALDGGNDGRPY